MAFNQTSVDMQKTFKLPLLPGNTCGQELLRRNFRKTQVLSGNGERTHQKQPSIPVDFSTTLASTQGKLNGSLGASSQAQQTQGSTADAQSLDRKVLRYYGYYKEAVQESSVEKSRIRKITLCYFLEDDTISVSEPRQDNSGIAFQGTMVKRHQIPSADGSGAHITFDQLAVGATISFYGRTFFLIDCDAFTRGFMESLGVHVAAPLELPADDYTASRNRPREKIQESMASNIGANGRKVKMTRDEIASTKSFLENDRKVLRCDVRWDDTATLYGEMHYFTLYYFVSDSTIEVVEKPGVNTGRDPFPSFVRRQKMMKPKRGPNGKPLTATFSATSISGATSTAGAEYYTEADLRIGNEIVLFNRPMLIYDYDKFTRDYLRENFGVIDYTPIDVSEPAKPRPVHEVPPPNGFGDPDEPISRKLDLKVPRKDYTKYAKFGDSAVKFALKLQNGVATDEIRKFVLTCFLADDTVSIFEPVQRNSGIVGGKFLQRQKVKNPETGKNFVAADFFVGKSVVINNFPFIVQATDERSLTFMEQHSSEFPQSNVNSIAHKMQAMLMSSQTGLVDAFHHADVDGSGHLDYKELVGMVKSLGLALSEQEIVTLLRYFDRNGDSLISYEEFAMRLMPEGSLVGRDDRPWEVIHSEMINKDHDTLSLADKVAQQKLHVDNTTAAYAARAFLEAYANRRSLFHSEFRFSTDYSSDSKIGAKEFRDTVEKKLQLGFSAAQLDALTDRLFPPGSRRVSYEEFLRLINGSSNLDHNLTDIKDRR